MKSKKKLKTVKVGKTVCSVETLKQWLDFRMDQIGFELQDKNKIPTYFESLIESEQRKSNLQGRFIELMIIKEKILDGRIQEIGVKKSWKL